MRALDIGDRGIRELNRAELARQESTSRIAIEYRPGEMHEAADAIVEVLRDEPDLYEQARRIVTVAHAGDKDRGDGIARDAEAPIVVRPSEATLQELISRRTRGERWDDRSETMIACDPRMSVIRAVHQRGAWGLPPLAGITTVPPLAATGEVCSTPGYGPVTRYYYAPAGPAPHVPTTPTADDVLDAITLIQEPFSDFPFENEAHRAATVAALLTPIARTAYTGNAGPLFLFDSHTPGSGKTLAADVIAIIATGRSAARSPYTSDDAEMKKRLTAHALCGDSLILIDNAPSGGRVGWSCLDAALTGTTWRDRVLGGNEMPVLPFRPVWMVTGNNLAVKGDLARRTLKIRLTTTLANPGERTGFRHDPLLPWVRAQRPALLGAALTLLRAYMLAKEKPKLSAFGSFEDWSALVRGCVVWASLADPIACCVIRDPESDPDAAAHTAALAHWSEIDPTGDGLTAAEVVRRIDPEDTRAPLDPIRDALQELCGDKSGKLSARTLGTRLRGLRGRRRTVGDRVAWFDGSPDRKGIARWRVIWGVS